jgi:SAM-dependent methyltransferase
LINYFLKEEGRFMAYRLELGPGGRRIHKVGDGGGIDKNIGIDFYGDYEPKPEIVWDLRYGLPWGKEALGVKIERGIFDDIYAEHVLEHIPRPVDPEDDYRVGFWKLMIDCYDALKVGGTFRGAVPHYADQCNVMDPTHVTTLHPDAFNYFGWYNNNRNIVVGWVPGFRPNEGRYFFPTEVNEANNQVGFILTKMK